MTLLVGIGGALVGGLATVLGVIVNQRSAAEISRKVDERHLRDGKAARLRAIYAPLVKVSLVVDQIASEVGYVRTDETVEERDVRHGELIRDAMVDAQQHYAAVVLDDDTAPVRDAYSKMLAAFDAYMRTVKNVAMEQGPSYAALRNKEFGRLRSAAESVRDVAQEGLRRFGNPI